MKMREILFHGKRADSGEWVEGDVLQTRYHSGHIEYQIMPQTPVSSAYPVLPETVGQYTGLTDKNGKRIFEGDILQYEWNGKKNVDYIEYSGNMFTYSKCIRFSLSDDEIIGNIHDNPELLGEEDT